MHELRTRRESYACGYSWPYDGAGCDTNQLFNLTKFQVHHDVTSFHGCRTATTWNIGDDLTTSSDCDLAIETPSAAVAQSDAVITCNAANENEEGEPIGCGGAPGSD